MHSRFYDSDGNTFDYVYELDGDTMTGPWVYPGGGGYDSTMTRMP